ncbi:hypothetical protein M7I_7354 [Glarea lozoyensis 74030]|uniref:Uncharacterized protein n=1 Tax=Glarea lozoyensis (strain ATCC 74030 / MF5533) TaxID=1104152 RepID=H0EX29_GLAL7|nr:hypothetical protein M7I_7354 [Glarea lozoyensis 74030]
MLRIQRGAMVRMARLWSTEKTRSSFPVSRSAEVVSRSKSVIWQAVIIVQVFN